MVYSPKRTFTGDESADDSPTAQPDLRRLPLARVGFLGFRDGDFETDAFHLGSADHGGTQGAALLLRFAAPIADLIDGREVGGGGGKGSEMRVGNAAR